MSETEREAIIEKYVPIMVNLGILYEKTPGMYQITDRFSDRRMECCQMLRADPGVKAGLLYLDTGKDIIENLFTMGGILAISEFAGNTLSEEDLNNMAMILDSILQLGKSQVL